MANFNHEPMQNIQEIRRLLDGYKGLGNFLKEIVQNAQDAEESDILALHYLPADEELARLHPLLSGPCLCVVNNGEFTSDDLDGIFRIGSGTKGDDPRKIGRFGLGLKSVFEYCDAFFLVSSKLVSSKKVRAAGERLWFLNPYESWKHDDWTEKSSQKELEEKLVRKTVLLFTTSC